MEQQLTDESRTSGERVASLATFNLQQIEDLNASANQVAGKLSKLSKLKRATFVALMTGDVHNRDIVALMAKEKVDSLGRFTWQMQLGFYWDEAEAGLQNTQKFERYFGKYVLVLYFWKIRIIFSSRELGLPERRGGAIT